MDPPYHQVDQASTSAPSTAGQDPSADHLLRMARRFCRVAHRYDPDLHDLDGLVRDTGGLGLCRDVSLAFLRFARRGCLEHLHVAGHPAYPAAECYRFPDGTLRDDHWVARFGRLRVDLTARQFGPHLPYPYLWGEP